MDNGKEQDGKKGKNIVVCCDGTKAEFGKRRENSNIVRLFQMLKPDGEHQISYYDPGIGTYSPSRGTITRWIEQQVMAASGWGMDTNVGKAYAYLMDYYEPGDRIFMFGYSRGAHTVREVAYLLHRCGLLTKGSENLIPFAMKMRKGHHHGQARRFKETFSRPCKPHLIGVFDTVAAVGWLTWRKYYRSRLPSSDLSFGFHALALDEGRFYFPPSRWKERNPDDQERGNHWPESLIPPPGYVHKNGEPGKPLKNPVIEQVWFPGYHGDVGGQMADRGIADISLEWMLEKAHEHGLELRPGWKSSLEPNPAGAIKQSRRHIWRLFPERKRKVPENSKIHRSVVQRMELLGEDYNPTNLPERLRVVH